LECIVIKRAQPNKSTDYNKPSMSI